MISTKHNQTVTVSCWPLLGVALEVSVGSVDHLNNSQVMLQPANVSRQLPGSTASGNVWAKGGNQNLKRVRSMAHVFIVRVSGTPAPPRPSKKSHAKKSCRDSAKKETE